MTAGRGTKSNRGIGKASGSGFKQTGKTSGPSIGGAVKKVGVSKGASPKATKGGKC